MATHSSTLAWIIPFRRAWQDTTHRVAESTEQQREPHIEHSSTGPPAPHAPSGPVPHTFPRLRGPCTHTWTCQPQSALRRTGTEMGPSKRAWGDAGRTFEVSGSRKEAVSARHSALGVLTPDVWAGTPLTQACKQHLLSCIPAVFSCPFYKQTHILQVNRLHLHTHTSTHRYPTLWLGILGRRQEKNQPPPSR